MVPVFFGVFFLVVAHEPYNKPKRRLCFSTLFPSNMARPCPASQHASVLDSGAEMTVLGRGTGQTEGGHKVACGRLNSKHVDRIKYQFANRSCRAGCIESLDYTPSFSVPKASRQALISQSTRDGAVTSVVTFFVLSGSCYFYFFFSPLGPPFSFPLSITDAKNVRQQGRDGRGREGEPLAAPLVFVPGLLHARGQPQQQQQQ